MKERIEGLFLSLSHDGEYSGAVVVLEKNRR
jgi:phosphopantetheinyl transferase (holo-ACP synthase)